MSKAEKNGRDIEVLLLVQHFKAKGYEDPVADATSENE